MGVLLLHRLDRRVLCFLARWLHWRLGQWRILGHAEDSKATILQSKEIHMDNASNDVVARDPNTGIDLDSDEVFEGDGLEKRISAGEITQEQADQLMQEASRRDIAEHGPDRLPDEGGTATEGGFGSDGSMNSQSRQQDRDS